MPTSYKVRRGVRLALIVVVTGSYAALAAYFVKHTLSSRESDSLPPAKPVGAHSDQPTSKGQSERLLAELTGLKKGLEEQKDRADRAEASLHEKESVNSALRTKLKKIFAEAKETESHAASLTREKKDLEQALAQSQNKLGEAERKLEEESRKREAAEKEAEGARSESAALAEKLAEKEERLEQVTSALTQSQKELTSLKEKVAALQKELDKLRGNP